MALNPKNLSTKDRLQPGAHGEQFKANLPGYRSDENRINRTNTKLNVSEHDVPVIKYELDDRILAAFRYGFGYGFNQVVIPKGRVVATEKSMNMVDFEFQKQHNVMTLANGGVPVRLRTDSDLYKNNGSDTGLISAEAKGKKVAGAKVEWIPMVGMEKAYADTIYRPFIDNTAEIEEGKMPAFVSANKQLEDAGFKVSTTNGRVVDKDTEVVDNTVREGNIPIGILQRTEYTRDIDAYNGIMPGPVLTDPLIELPWFAYKDKAESNPWGSAYGNLFPGALVKSDENGRITLSPLSIPSVVETMTLPEYEMERQQVIGQVYSATTELVPEGAAKWTTWALEDRLNYEGFNPDVYRKTNRKNEDSINQSPHNSTGEYPGYPFEPSYNQNNLNMLGSTMRNGKYNPAMDAEYQYENLGIPGITDGYNAVVRTIPKTKAGEMHHRGSADEYIDWMFRLVDVDVEPGSIQIAVGTDALTNCDIGVSLKNGAFKVVYCNPLQGIIKLKAEDKAKADEALKDGPLEVAFTYKKRGLAGVPTFMDWDGCVGSCYILMQK